MKVHLPILILLLLSLALGPARITAACHPSASVQGCHNCCDSPDRSCCAAPGKPASREYPASLAPQSQDVKQMVSPVVVVLDVSLRPARELVSAHHWQAAGAPCQARVAVTCIRLI